MKTINTNNLKTGDTFIHDGIEWEVTRKESDHIIARATNEEVFEKLHQGKESIFADESVCKEEFKPARGIREKVRDYLLKGYAVKFDGGATNTILIIPRGQLNHTEVTFTQMSNLSRGSEIPGAITLPRCDVWEVLKELAAEGYSILSKECHSGCCQYHTNVKYLAEDQG